MLKLITNLARDLGEEIIGIGKIVTEMPPSIKVFLIAMISFVIGIPLSGYHRLNYADVPVSEYKRIQVMVEDNSDVKDLFFKLYDDKILSRNDCRKLDALYEQNTKSEITKGMSSE